MDTTMAPANSNVSANSAAGSSGSTQGQLPYSFTEKLFNFFKHKRENLVKRAVDKCFLWALKFCAGCIKCLDTINILLIFSPL